MIEYRLKPGYEWADVLVVVKTYPAPSRNHGETVCVAGVRLDGASAPSWIRLYPISFRALESTDQFRKYERISIPVLPRGTYDPRPESYKPAIDGITKIAWYDSGRNWIKRRELIEPLIGEVTTCELIEQNRDGRMSDAIPSLGMVRAHVSKVEVEAGGPWTAAQYSKVRRFSEADLFNPEGRNELQPVPYQVKISYKCDEPRCGGHAPHLIDWELGAMGLSWPARYGSNTASMIRGKYEALLDSSSNDVHLIVGNQHQRRHIFSVCGVWSPKR